jgi:hypothetical protein
MIEYLGRAEKDSALEDFLKENIFFTMIPFDERDVFRNYLDKALNSNEPIRIRHRIRCGDEQLKNFVGWLSITENENNKKEYVFIYMPDERKEKSVEDNPYFNALKNTYNVIFEIKPLNDTIECIHGRETSEIGSLYDAVMTLESAQEFWINNFFYEDDRDMMSKYLAHICSATSDWGDKKSIQAKFRLRWTNGIVYDYIGIAIKLNKSTVLFCVSRLVNYQLTATTSTEYLALSKYDNCMEKLVKYNKDALGMLLFEEVDGNYMLLYASSDVRNYFGINQDYYMQYIAHELPNEDCLKAINFSTEKFEKLLKERTINYTVNLDDAYSKNIIISCSTIYQDDTKIHEILILDNDEAQAQELPDIPASGIFVRTFGHFDVFVDGQPITFTNDKEKELLALLIDRNGGTLTTNEAIGYLWEDEDVNEKTSARYRKLAMGLKNTLAKHNIEHILINHHGVRNVDVSAFTCDYYELIAGNVKYQKMFHNAYMSNYSWAEDTLATLWDYS